MRGSAGVVFLLMAGALCGQTPPLSPQTLMLSKIRLRAASNLRGLPNYTCLETIERSLRRASSRRYELVDVLRMEVAFVDGKEMFAWPGSDRFDDRDITDIVGGGAIGNGAFALHVHGVFLSGVPTYIHIGDTVLDGKPSLQFNYRVPRLSSGFKIRSRPAEGIVGYEGSFWLDPANLDLRRLTLKVTDIPPQLPVSGSTQTLDYARTKIGEKDFLLPVASEMTIADLEGNDSRNRTRFTNCREYAIESVISFSDVPDGPVMSRKAPEKTLLPSELDIDIKLETPIDVAKSAVGDPLRAIVARDAKRKGQVIVPKGAVVTGRLVKLQRQPRDRFTFWIAGLEFNKVEFGDQFAELNARLDASITGQLPFTGPELAQMRTWRNLPDDRLDDRRIGILYIKGETGRIMAGSRLIWRTLSPNNEEKQ